MPRLLPDAVGALIPPGRIKRELVAHFLDGAPGAAGTSAWWTTLGGGTFTAPSLSTGADCLVTSGAVAGNIAEVQGRPVELRFMRGVMWTVEGLSVDSIANVDIKLSIEGTNVGAQFFHLSASTDPVLRRLKSGGNVDLALPWAKLRSTTNRKNLSMLLLGRQYGEAYLFQDDQCLGYTESDTTWAAAVGNVTPKITVTTQAAAARVLHFTQLRQTIWSD